MVAFKDGLIFAFIIGLSSANDLLIPPSPCPLDNARHLPIYDLENVTYNILQYDDLLNSFSKNGFYQFNDVDNTTYGVMYYHIYPTLVVYQPDENIPELHGFYYPTLWGLLDIYKTDGINAEGYAEYQPFRDYLNSPIDKEGYTPSAALQIYPELESMKLTELVLGPTDRQFSSGYALLFLLPKSQVQRPENFDRRYTLFDEFYYNGTNTCRTPVTDYYRDDDDAVDVIVVDDDGDDDDEYVPFLAVYGHRSENSGANRGYNVLDYDQVDEYSSRNGFYKFDNFVEDFSPYDEYPTLIVFQPDENVPELHGYYFEEGILHLIDNFDLDEYRPFFDYLEQEEPILLDGLTPDAARFDYPYFFDYNLTTFIHGQNIATQFGTLFLAPNRYRPTNFLEKYGVIEDYGLGQYSIVEYEV